MNRQKANITDFLNEIKEKKLYCYGAGNIFKDFVNSYPDISVSAVIDMNRKDDYIDIDDKRIPIISVESFIKEVNNAVLLVTCFDYLEVERQLELYAELSEIPYYVYCMLNAESDSDNVNTLGKYQITEFRLQDYNAGRKAPTDVAEIAVNNGYKALTIVRGTIRCGKQQTDSEWINACNAISNNAIVLVQFPIIDVSGGIYRLVGLKKSKNVKIICVVHDVEVLRRVVSDDYLEQYYMLNICPDIWIVHNEKMKKVLVSRGFPADRIISLQIFDYLIQHPSNIKKDDGVIIAGNLDAGKSEYVYHLNEIKDVSFNLFGANYSDKNNYTNINYFGTFLPDELIQNLQGKYGLVWDGDSLDTCSGLTGEYLKINNPHKLSLYLAVGLPVIIWEEAAEAEFVLKENVGFTVKSLYELPDRLAAVNEADYEIMRQNARAVGERLRKGEYMTRAIKEAEMKIQEIRRHEGE